MFFNDDLSNEEWDTNSNHEEEIYSDADVSSSNQKEKKKIYLAMMNLLEILGIKIKLSFNKG